MVLPPGEQHGVGGGLRSLTAFLVISVINTRKLHFLLNFVIPKSRDWNTDNAAIKYFKA